MEKGIGLCPSVTKEFAQIWFANLKEQGFFGDKVVLTILSP